MDDGGGPGAAALLALPHLPIPLEQPGPTVPESVHTALRKTQIHTAQCSGDITDVSRDRLAG